MTLYNNNNSSNKKISSNKKKIIYQFQYETSTDVFYGCLDQSWDHSIISLNRLMNHGLETDETKLSFKKVTTFNYTRKNKFDNIKGIHEITILFENSSGGIGLNGVNVNGASFKKEKVEKRTNVLVLKESDVDFRLGNDFITENNIVIERSNKNKGKFTHQLRFDDGVTVDLEIKYVDDDDADDVGSRKNLEHGSNDKFKNFLSSLNSRIGLRNLLIFFLILLLINLYNPESQSLVEELTVLPYNKKFSRPGIDDKFEDYARKLKTTTSFLELFELDKHQNSKPSLEELEGGGEGGEEEEKVQETKGQELYTNLIEFTESLDKTKRILLDTYNQEISYFWLFQQNIKNLLKYFSSKKKSRIIPFIGRGEYFPLTKNFEILIDDIEKVIINNIDLVMKKLITAQAYCDGITFQVEKMKVELDLFIKDSSKPFSSWLNAFLIRFSNRKGGNIDNLGEIDYETALKFKKLLMVLDNDLFEISKFFTDSKYYLNNHLNDLLTFSNYFKVKTTRMITDDEINPIKKHLTKLQNNRRMIFDEILVNNDYSEDDEPLNGCRMREIDHIIECSN